VTLRYMMMMHRIDRFCARMNNALAAVAIVLSLVTGTAAVIRLAQVTVALAMSGQ